MFLVNSRYPRFVATILGSPSELVHPKRHTLSLSYGVNLQSSFTRVLSSALVFSTYPPVSVYSTDTDTAPPAAFLGSMGPTSSSAAEALDSHHVSGITQLPFDRTTDPYSLEPVTVVRLVCPSPSLLASMPNQWCRNINLLSIAYAARPQLRIRLTLGGLTLPRNPWVFGERVSHPFYRYSCPHMPSEYLQPRLR